MYNSEVSRANLNFRVYTLKQITLKLPKPLDTTYQSCIFRAPMIGEIHTRLKIKFIKKSHFRCFNLKA